jgi:tetratricopeptide (TPR) repeat protein
LKRNLLHLLVPVTALALSACGTVGQNTLNQPFDYPQSDGFAGNYLAGKVAQSNNATSQAAQYLLRAQQLDPENDDLRRRAFLALISDGRISDTQTIARQLLLDHPQDLFAVLAVADADMRNKDYEAALKTVNTLPDRGLNSLIRPLARAWLFTALDRKADALAALDHLQGNGTLAPLSEYHRGLILDYFGDLNGAERALASAYGDPADAPLRAAEALGAIYERKGQTQKAELLYQSYIDRHPQSLAMPYHLERLKKGEPPISTALTPASGLAEGYLDIATLLSQENAVEPALLMARYSLSLRPGDAVTKLLVGEVMEIQKRWPAAIAIYQSIPENSPHSWNARLREASSLTEIDKNDDAIAILRKMVNERSDRADALIQLGDVLRTTKKFGPSAQAYSDAIDRLGGAQNVGWRLLYRRGIAYEQDGQWPKAEKDFLLALEMEPDQPYIMNYLGYSWVDMGMHFDKAQAMLKRAVELKPDDGFIVDSLGWVYYKLGHYDAAVKELEHAVSLIPDDPTVNDHLGDAYYQIGRHHEAEFQWRRALSFEPKPALRKDVMEKLNGKKPATGTVATH